MNKKWIDEEFQGVYKDKRLGERIKKIANQLSGDLGGSIPAACEDWANTKAAYRFFSNDRVEESEILQGHMESSKKRSGVMEGPLLVLHDTTEFSYRRKRTDLIGMTHEVCYKNRERHTVCGLLMHSSIIITAEGLPIGLGAIKFWTRDSFKRTRELARKVNPTRIPIETKESYRWIENLVQST